MVPTRCGSRPSRSARSRGRSRERPLLGELGVRMHRVEVLSGPGVDELVEGDGARLRVAVEEAGDPLRAIAQPVTSLAVLGGRVEIVATDAPAIKRDRLGHGTIVDVPGDPLAAI